MRLNWVHGGFGDILPHQVQELDNAGNPTGSIIRIRSTSDVRRNVAIGAGVFPTPPLPATAIGPDGRPSNQFLSASFTLAVDPLSIFDLQTGGLTEAISLTATAGGTTTPVQARVLVGGWTVVPGAAGFELASWGQVDPDTGLVQAVVPEAVGLPTGVPLASFFEPNVVVVIADTDDDLSTLETFPSGAQINLRLETGITGDGGEPLENQALASTTVGADVVTPTVGRGPSMELDVMPAAGAVGVDPTSDVVIRFSEPIQPSGLGIYWNANDPIGMGSIALSSGGAAALPVAYGIELESPFDLSTYRLTPIIAMPAEPLIPSLPDFNLISVASEASGLVDLAGLVGTASDQWSFRTGPGAGIVNAPILPEAVVAIGEGAAGPTAMVLDLNGFGASTGNPVSSSPVPLAGESRFPYDPNFSLTPTIRPVMVAGTMTLDGGSAGVFTLTRDSNLESGLTTAASVESLDDAHLGHPLDTAFRNGPPPFGCQLGGGDICSAPGLKVMNPVLDLATMVVEPDVINSFGPLGPDYGNVISWAPHPNPPQLNYPGLCVLPTLLGQEPSWAPFTSPNLLVPGNPFPDLAGNTPPTGKLSLVQTAYFGGPSPDGTQLIDCDIFEVRQKVGHYLYVADRARNEVVVLDSNNMTVIERIAIPDPAELAMSPNLDVLAVVNPLADTVAFIDINPASAQFHQIIQTTLVGQGPSGAAWSPDNEDLIVCNEIDGTLSIIEAAALQVRRIVQLPAGEPFQVVMTEREENFGLMRGVYYGYVLSRSGALSVFESGPRGINGWGYDDVLGTLPFTFLAPKAIQLDLESEGTAFVVAHEGAIDPATGTAGTLGDGAISRVVIDSGATGPQPLGGSTIPQFRSIDWRVTESFAESNGRLSGIPVDVAFDEMHNLGALPDWHSIFAAGSPLPANGKGLRRPRFFGMPEFRCVRPRFLMAAIAEQNVIDVLEGDQLFDTDPYQPGVQSVPAQGVRSLVTYWRQ